MSDAEMLERRAVFQGRVIELFVDRVRLPGGQVAELETIHHRGAAAAVPIDDRGDVLLVRQYRHAAGGWLLEIPAGKLDAGESPELCATREVEEETGHRPGRLIPMGWIFTTPGFTDERIWLYAALALSETRQSLQEHEVLSVERRPLGEAIELAERGEIRDAKSVCALLRVARFLGAAAPDASAR